MGTRLFVGNLSYQTTEDELRDLFAGVANVTSVSVITERESGRSKGFAFVELATPEDAQKAIDQLNGQSLRDRTIRVDLARPRQGGGSGGPPRDRSQRRERREQYPA